jgi:hypothetical protein
MDTSTPLAAAPVACGADPDADADPDEDPAEAVGAELVGAPLRDDEKEDVMLGEITPDEDDGITDEDEGIADELLGAMMGVDEDIGEEVGECAAALTYSTVTVMVFAGRARAGEERARRVERRRDLVGMLMLLLLMLFCCLFVDV